MMYWLGIGLIKIREKRGSGKMEKIGGLDDRGGTYDGIERKRLKRLACCERK